MDISCPACGSNDRLHYKVVPDSRLNYTSRDGSDTTEHFGPIRDYTCRNCDFKFLVEEDEIEQSERAMGER